MKELLKSSNWIAGLQWLFFIFTNIVVIPITVGAAFDLEQNTIVSLLQLSFIVTGVACIAQAVLGHKRAIMEGQSGLWWGVFLTLVVAAAAQEMPLSVLGGSLAVGVIISGIITIVIGLTGLGSNLSGLFNSSVMGVFMFLFGCQLISIFMKGMLGIPFGNPAESGHIHVSISLLSIIVAAFVIIISVKASANIRKYGLLIGIIIGWIAYVFIFGSDASINPETSLDFKLFPLGKPTWDMGIILTAVLTGLLNTANTFGALKGTDAMYKTDTDDKQYRNSFTITGIFTCLAGLLGLVPYAPYVSSIGFLRQTGIIERIPFIIGGFMFFIMGIIPQIGAFFSLLPLSIGSAVLFVAYLQLFNSSWDFFKHVHFNTINVYRTAIPLFVGIIIMTMPASYFETLPNTIRPLISNGLLVGITLSLILENVIPWDKLGKQHELNHESQRNIVQ